jgi:GNAT superfamily N-acetyltransferase
MMTEPIQLQDITIRTTLQSGDIGSVTRMHGLLYKREYNYDFHFESYVAAGLHEFAEQYNPARDRVWLCEHNNTFAGSIFLMNRGEAAQLRYFLLEPAYRGIGLGKTLMELYMDFARQAGYTSSYLWTTHELETAASLYKRYGFQLTEEKTYPAWGKTLSQQRYDVQL